MGSSESKDGGRGPAPAMDADITIFLITSTGKQIQLTVQPKMTIAELKLKVQDKEGAFSNPIQVIPLN
jgi:hypothetical protein